MLPIVVISVLGGLSQGVLCIYTSGLDLEGIAPQLKRTQTTIITAAVAIVLLYVGPLADVAAGVDLSTIGSAMIAGVIYAVAGLGLGHRGDQAPVGQPLVDVA